MDSDKTFKCICGESFDSMERLREHWQTNNSETTGRPHYRDGIVPGIFRDFSSPREHKGKPID